MSAPTKPTPPDFDEEFLQAVAQWREKHKIKEGDAILLLLELFVIHQKHWDELRRRQMPSLDGFRQDIGLLTQAARFFKENTRAVDVATAIFAAVSAFLAGILITKAWL
jgi:hypothetical protein